LSRVAGFMHGLPVEDYLTGPLPPIQGEASGARGLAALEAWELVCDGEERERAVELARFAVADRVLQRSDPGLLWVVAGNALFLCGVDTVPFWEAELDAAHRSGSMFASLACHLWLGFVLWQRGELDAADQSLSAGTEQNFAWSLRGIGQMYVQPFTAHIQLDRGDVAAAREVIDRSRDTLRMGDSVRLFLEAEARVLQAEGRHEQALAVLDEAETLMQVVRNPVWRRWRSQRAEVLDSLGRTDEALALVREELVLAQRWGTPGLVGRTLGLLGVLEREAGEATLRSAVDHLERSPLRLDLARARAALAGLADDAEARSLLGSALELAGECGALGLWREVAPRLQGLGVDVPDRPAPRERLTTTERRIAAMAAEGRHPNEIAQAFFLTVATVRSVTASVMERLGVGSVDELDAALHRA
jgi:DNA-binding CsgD family transcriptional regulator